MPIADIINEIDAYLSSLRHARELLSAPIKAVPTERAPRRRRKLKIGKRVPAVSSKPRAQKRTVRSAGPAPERERVKRRVRIDPVPQVRSSLPRPAAQLEEQPKIEAAKPMPPPVVARQKTNSAEVLSSPKRVHSVRSLRRSSARPVVRPKMEVVKPAIALSGSMHSKIVVVSAEQARQERDRAAAPPEVRRPRLPSTGLSGKMAFEALFKDSPDPSKSSEQ